MKNYLQNRERAMAWMNSAKHDFAQGIAILKDAGFKPGVVGVLERHGSGHNQSDERLLYHMRDFIRCFANAEARQDTDLSLSVVDGKELQPDQPKNGNVPSMFADSTTQQLEAGTFPEPIAKVISRYREAYVSREKLMRQMQELPETNDDETVEKRRRISDEMARLSDEMDKLYPQYEAYIKQGVIHEEEKENPSVQPAQDTPDKKQLQKERKSVATKILRARNMLLYQTETKQPVENPMTDEKKVIKYQAKIDRLTELLNTIDKQLAALG